MTPHGRVSFGIGITLSIVVVLATSVTASAQSGAPSAIPSGEPVASPAASPVPNDCVAHVAPSTEPTASSAPGADPAASMAPVDSACVAGPDAAFVAAYADLYHGYVSDATPIVKAINSARSWTQHRRAWSRLEKVQAAYVEAIVALPWPDDFTDLVDRWERLQRDRVDVMEQMVRVRDNKTLRRLSRQDGALSNRITPISTELRERLGVE